MVLLVVSFCLLLQFLQALFLLGHKQVSGNRQCSDQTVHRTLRVFLLAVWKSPQSSGMWEAWHAEEAKTSGGLRRRGVKVLLMAKGQEER